MYPPQMDSIRDDGTLVDATKFRNKGHFTVIGENGAIETVDRSSGAILFRKAGADGRGIRRSS